MATLAAKKQYVARILLKGGPFTRAYDRVLEGSWADEVVRYLVKRGQTDMALQEAIKRQGTWGYWNYFADHGTYQGYKPTTAF